MEEEWIKVKQPGKVVAKILFPNEQKLSNKRRDIIFRASKACNILELRLHGQATTPRLCISVKNQSEIQKLRDAIPENGVQEEVKLDLLDSRKVVLIASSPKCDMESVKRRMNDFGTLIYSASFTVQKSMKIFLPLHL